jgi:signal recognition particle receptor subunit beta
MALFNYATKEITLKIVYYGPGLSGKTTNLQYLHSVLNPQTKGKLLSLSTESDRTLFFDFLPVELGKIRDFSIRFQLYTVPGQVRYNATRKVVLKGADAVVFVADSQGDMREQNADSFQNMRENLYSNNIDPDEIPVVLQYNKRDLTNILSVEELNTDLNHENYHVVEASAVAGTGVEDSFRLITRLLLKHISKKHKIDIQPAQENEEAAAETAFPQGIVPESPAFEAAAHEEFSPIYDLEEEKGAEVAEPEYGGVAPFPVEAARKGAAITEAVEVQAFPAEKVDSMAVDIERIKELLVSLTASVSELSTTLKQPRESKTDREIESIKSALAGMQGSLSALDAEIREIRKEQKDTGGTLRSIVRAFDGLKTRKRWFRF